MKLKFLINEIRWYSKYICSNLKEIRFFKRSQFGGSKGLWGFFI